MKMKVFRLKGEVINVGDWDYMIRINKETGEETIGNPLPVGVVESEEDVVVNKRGRFAVSDYRKLRKNEYPQIEDQIDAIWKGGDTLEEMRQKVLSVKLRYPKP